MAFQTAVYAVPPMGVVGGTYSDAPISATNYIAASTPTVNYVGYAYTLGATAGTVKCGGTGTFAGIAVNTKDMASNGASSNPLDVTLAVPDGNLLSIATDGEFIVRLASASAPGNKVIYATATGALDSVAPATAPATGNMYAYATVIRANAGTNGLAAIRLDVSPVILPVPL